MYPPITGSNANGPTIFKYNAYSMALKSFIGRNIPKLHQILQMSENITVPPQKLEMRYRKDQDKYFYHIVDIFKTIVTSQGHLANNVPPGSVPPNLAASAAKTK